MAAVLKSSMINASVSSPEAVTEGARRATGETASGAARPDPEVVATARRRQYSVSEKRTLLAGADEAKARGELGAFLRRKRIYLCCRAGAAGRGRRPRSRPGDADPSPMRLPGRSST